MDVIVDRTGVVGVFGEHPFQDLDDFGRPALGPLTTIFPIVPGGENHERLGIEDRDLCIGREAGPHPAHGLGISRIQCRAVGLGVV
jgi:hypothetical protein